MTFPHRSLFALALCASLAGCATPRQPAAPAPEAVTAVATAVATPAAPVSPTLEATVTKLPAKPEAPITVVINPSVTPITPDQASQGAGIIATFRWSGGIAGRNDLWTLHAGGLIETNKGERRTLTAAQVESFLAEVERLGYFNMPAPGGKDSGATCADCFVFNVMISNNGRTREMKLVDDGKLPGDAQELITLLRGMLTGAA